METTATAKGQIVIPSALRRKFGIKEGTRIQVEADEKSQCIVLRPVTRDYVHSLRGRYRGHCLVQALAKSKHRERDR